MTIETLKKLIEIEFERTGTISQFKHEVLRLIDLYESDKVDMTEPKLYPDTRIPGYQWPILTNPCVYVNNLPDEVPYSDICPCNPKNGGSGVCGCTMGNKMVPNPNKYTYQGSNGGTTTSKDIKIN